MVSNFIVGIVFVLYLKLVCCSDRPSLLGNSRVDRIPEDLFQLPLQDSDAIIEDIWRPQTRSLLEPRELDSSYHPRPSKPVRYSGPKTCEGACISTRACDYHLGVSKGYCSNGNVCCVFQKSCGGIAQEKISFFRSPYYPKPLNESLDCSYRIYPSEDTCALRIDFEKFALKKAKRYTKVEKCVDDIMFIMNSAAGATEGICEMENHTAIVEVQPNSSQPITIVFVVQSNNYSWSLKISHVNCKKIDAWKNVPECGRQLMFEPNEFDSDGQLINAFTNPLRSNLSEQNVQGLSSNPYIVNGKDSETSEFPWQVSLQVKSKSSHRCGGSIINERHVLTAAHCLYRNAFASADKLKVIVGDYILDTEEDGKHEEFDIEKIIVHYNYKPSESHVNDIAVIRLNGTLKFNEKVQPICLLTEDFNVYNKKAVVSGWGRLNGTDTSAVATRLQKLNVNIIDNAKCRELVKQEYEDILKRNMTYAEVAKSSILGISNTQICGLSAPSTSICFGDSGGPLVIQDDEDGRYYQAGVVSYGLGKCRTDRQIPGSYTNVQKYLKFIALATMES